MSQTLDTSQLSSPTDDGMPTPSDSAQGGSQGPSHTGSLVNYYFVFLALVVCIAGATAFWIYKKKKINAGIVMRGREGALERDLNTWDPMIRARRRYWHGRSRWRSTDQSREEEGLNELGEAPPPYMPGKEVGQQNGANQPTVPMQSLSREQTALKPPDYTEIHARPVDEDANTPSPQAPQQPQTTRQAP